MTTTYSTFLAGMRTCECGFVNRFGSLFCDECGKEVGAAKARTPARPVFFEAITPEKHDVHETLHVRKARQGFRAGTCVFSSGMRARLQIRGSSTPIMISPMESQAIILGRKDEDSGFVPGIDLVPYGAYARGISRRHAALLLSRKRLTIRDLKSSNGTYINQEMLDPHEAHQLRDGDEVRLGNLVIKVNFDPFGI